MAGLTIDLIKSATFCTEF